MKQYCVDFRRLIALDVEGDLGDGERMSVRAHLRECSECWDLAEDLRESQALLKSIRSDVPDLPPTLLPELVLAEIDKSQRNVWLQRLKPISPWPIAALAGLAFVVVVVAFDWVSQGPPAVSRELPAGIVAAPTDLTASANEVEAAEQAPSTPSKPASSPDLALRPAAADSREPEQVTIQFLTDDPNIIIYWLVDEKGD